MNREKTIKQLLLSLPLSCKQPFCPGEKSVINGCFFPVPSLLFRHRLHISQRAKLEQHLPDISRITKILNQRNKFYQECWNSKQYLGWISYHISEQWTSYSSSLLHSVSTDNQTQWGEGRREGGGRSTQKEILNSRRFHSINQCLSSSSSPPKSFPPPTPTSEFNAYSAVYNNNRWSRKPPRHGKFLANTLWIPKWEARE